MQNEARRHPGRAARVTSAADTSPATPARLRRADIVLLVFVVLFAFGLRLAYIWQLRSSPLFAHPQMDELYHDQWAQAITGGELFAAGPYFRAPLYPAFLAAIYTVFGHDYLVARVVQALLGSLSCGLLFLIGRRVFGTAVGAIAAFVAASYWMLIYFDGELLIPVLIVFLDLLLIWLLLRAMHGPSARAYGLAGVVLGLSAIARPNILLFGPAIVLWLVVIYRGRWWRALQYVVCVTAGCLLVVLPITVRNYIVGGDLVLIASQGGVNFYIGNNPDSDGRTAIVPGTPGDWWGGYHATIARAEQARGRKLRASEVSNYYYEQAWRFIRSQPGDFLRLTACKFRLFWSRWEISNNKSIHYWTERFTPIVRFLPIRFWLIGPLGILGLVLCGRRRAELFPIWGFVLVYMVGVVAFFCTARYRMPVIPPLILLGVYALFEAIRAVRRARWAVLAGGAAVLALAGALVGFTPDGEDSVENPSSYVMMGNAYEEEGRLDLAIESHRRALELDPGHLLARYNLGTVLAQSNRFSEAIVELRRALSTPPQLKYGETRETIASAHNNLANALVETGELAEAVEHFRVAVRLYPREARATPLLNLARTLSTLGRHGEAADALRQLLEVTPGNSGARCWLGQTLFAAGRYSEALTPLRQCVQLQPDNATAVDCLSSALIYFGRFEEVSALLHRALSLDDSWLVNRLAFLLATCPDNDLRDGAAALEYARQACPDVASCGPAYLDATAAALAETGRFDAAVRLARQALERARQSPAPADRQLIEGIEKRLALYESGRPYRLSKP